MPAYYNENDKFAAAWLRELIKQGLIADGYVDERSIKDVRGSDLAAFKQCHFFAGIGGWSRAFRLAGIRDDANAWSGSCPCQPWSIAGTGRGALDARHLWPDFARLIAECRPTVVVGEQVASKDGRFWLAGVRTDLEILGYDVGAADLCAAGVGEKDSKIINAAKKECELLSRVARDNGDTVIADQLRDFAVYLGKVIVGPPHLRQRLWWVADANGGIAWHGRVQPGGEYGQQSENGGAADNLGHASSNDKRWNPMSRTHREGEPTGGSGLLCNDWLANPEHAERRTFDVDRENVGDGYDAGRPETHSIAGARGEVRAAGGNADAQRTRWTSAGSGSKINTGVESKSRRSDLVFGCNFWSEFDLIPCSDGKTRRVEPGVAPLATGISGRVGKLRGYGNAIVPQVAKEFLEAFCEIKESIGDDF